MSADYMPRALELGIDTFGDRTAQPDGTPVAYGQVIRDVVAQAEVADQIGIDRSRLARTMLLFQFFGAKQPGQFVGLPYREATISGADSRLR